MLPTRKRQKPDRHSKKNTVSQRRAPLRQQQKLASLVSTPPSTVSSSFRSFLSFPPSLLLFNDSRRRHYPHTAYTRAGSSTDSSTELEPGPACWYPRARCCLWSCCCWTAAGERARFVSIALCMLRTYSSNRRCWAGRRDAVVGQKRESEQLTHNLQTWR